MTTGSSDATGPFCRNIKELIAGFWIWQCESKKRPSSADARAVRRRHRDRAATGFRVRGLRRQPARRKRANERSCAQSSNGSPELVHPDEAAAGSTPDGLRCDSMHRRSFSKRCARCVFTVRSLMSSSLAISLLALPSASSLSVGHLARRELHARHALRRAWPPPLARCRSFRRARRECSSRDRRREMSLQARSAFAPALSAREISSSVS